jgi:hypothetical protein
MIEYISGWDWTMGLLEKKTGDSCGFRVLLIMSPGALVCQENPAAFPHLSPEGEEKPA